MPTLDNYITLDEFKVSNELTSFNFVDYDAQNAITAASRGVDEYTGRFFYQGTAQQRLYELGSERCLRVDDVVTVSTVEVDYDRSGSYETTWVSGTDYVVQPFNAAYENKPYEQLELLPNAAFHTYWVYPPLVRVTGTFGWPAVPSQVREVTSIMAGRLLKRKREAPFGVIGVGHDGNAIRIAHIDPDLHWLIDPLIRGRGVMAA